MSSSRHGFLLTSLFAAIFLVGASSAESQTCDDLSGIDFGPCRLILGYGMINGECQVISGCSSPVPLFNTQEECKAGCSPTCDDLSNIDFGPCDAVLGVGVINGECQVISGCSSPVPLFTTIEECESQCAVPIEPSTWGKIKSKYVKSGEE